MVVSFKETQIILSEENKTITIRYFVTKNLLKKDYLYDKVFSLNVGDCFQNVDDFSHFDIKENWNKMSQINCKFCNNVLIKENMLHNKKLVINFNYDYIENLQLLSCHEGDINNIIPNLDDKLKHM